MKEKFNKEDIKDFIRFSIPTEKEQESLFETLNHWVEYQQDNLYKILCKVKGVKNFLTFLTKDGIIHKNNLKKLIKNKDKVDIIFEGITEDKEDVEAYLKTKQ